MTPPEGHDVTAALQLATALADARGKRYRVLADAAEHQLAADLVGRISARVAAATGADIPEVPRADNGQQQDERMAYSVPEVARFLGTHPHTVRRQVQAGKLGARRAGNHYLIPTQALADYLDGRDDPIRSAS